MSSYDPLRTNSLTRQRSLDLIVPKPLGMILLEADLVSPSQIKAALQDQIDNPNLLLGEILATRNWIQPKTADFFAQDWSDLIQHQQQLQKPLGWYLEQAALLNQVDIKTILEEQKVTGVRFGTVAVLQGLLKSTTLDFFLMYLFPQEFNVSPFRDMRSSKKHKRKWFWENSKPDCGENCC